MVNITIDKSLNDHLGLPDDYKIDKVEAFKIYQYMNKLHPVDKPMNYYRLFFYVDHNGDFVNDPKNKRDYVVKAIFDNMEKSDQFNILTYINDHLEENSD